LKRERRSGDINDRKRKSEERHRRYEKEERERERKRERERERNREKPSRERGGTDGGRALFPFPVLSIHRSIMRSGTPKGAPDDESQK